MRRLTPLISNVLGVQYPSTPLVSKLTIPTATCYLYQSDNRSRTGVVINTFEDGSEVLVAIIDRGDPNFTALGITFDTDGTMDDSSLLTDDIDSFLRFTLNDDNPLLEFDCNDQMYVAIYNTSGSNANLNLLEKS